MVLKLYGIAFSTCTRRVGVVLKEKNIPFEFHPIDFLKLQHKSPEYLEKQPFGQVPYIDDDGFILFESRAIGRYLDAKHPTQGTPLIPKDLKALAKFEQAASIEFSDFEPYASGIAAERVFKKMKGEETNEARVSEYVDTLNKKLAAYEVILGKQKFLAGDSVTLADLFHLPYGYIVLKLAGVNWLEGKPNVTRWWNEISSRASWEAVKDSIPT